MAKQDSNQGQTGDVAKLRADRERAQADGDTAKVAELDEQIRVAEQQGNTPK